MTGLARYALPGLTGLLAVVLLTELLAGPEDRGPERLGHLPSTRGGMPTHEPLVGRWAATALARPLFAADRRPEQDGQTSTSLARLSAIIIAGGSRSAIFAAEGQKPRVVPEGGEIGGYKLLHITSDSVELGGPTGTLSLHPQFHVTVPPPPPPRPVPTPSSVDYDNL